MGDISFLVKITLADYFIFFLNFVVVVVVLCICNRNSSLEMKWEHQVCVGWK